MSDFDPVITTRPPRDDFWRMIRLKIKSGFNHVMSFLWTVGREVVTFLLTPSGFLCLLIIGIITLSLVAFVNENPRLLSFSGLIWLWIWLMIFSFFLEAHET